MMEYKSEQVDIKTDSMQLQTEKLRHSARAGNLRGRRDCDEGIVIAGALVTWAIYTQGQLLL